MKKTNIIYWVLTGLFSAFMIFSAIPDILSSPVAVQGMHDGLGYPVYFVPFIGVAKLLGSIAILIPRLNRIKEWAYAGLFFDLIGATYSMAVIGANVTFMILPFALGIAAYVFYLKRKRLQSGSRSEIATERAFAGSAALQ